MLDQPVGVLTVDSYQPNAYSEADAQLVLAFADQAATAVANARLYAESQQQTRTMALMAETTRMIVSSLDLERGAQPGAGPRGHAAGRGGGLDRADGRIDRRPGVPQRHRPQERFH